MDRRRYELEGIVLDIPLYFDEQARMYIEDYPDFTKDPVWTALGNRVMFAGEDACGFAQEATPGGCPDCGCCKFYRRAAAHTWIGVCQHPHHRKSDTNTHLE